MSNSPIMDIFDSLEDIEWEPNNFNDHNIIFVVNKSTFSKIRNSKLTQKK